MKTQIKQFFLRFFYFNTNERKGLTVLFFLMVFLQGLSFSYKYYVSAEDVPELSMIELDWLADTSTTNLYKKRDYNHPNRYANSSKKYLFSHGKDTVYLNKKNSIKYPVDINSADSISLVYLPKIGPYLASKIIEYRTKLGGFHSIDQLTEIWSFKEDYLYDLSGKIWVDPKNITYLPINKVSFDELKSHPYFKYSLSRTIINYRMQHGNYKGIDDLKKIKTVNDSILHLIKPYIRFD